MPQGQKDEDRRSMNLGLGLDGDVPDQSHSLSRLSICTADPTTMAMPMEAAECSDGGGGDEADDDVDVSDGAVCEKDTAAAGNFRGLVPAPGLLFQADHHSSLPETPTGTPRLLKDYFCYYASDDDAPRRDHRRANRGRGGGERKEVSNPSDLGWVKRANIFGVRTAAGDSGEDDGDGDGDGSSGGGELNQFMVITRPKGGRRPLLMDLEEVKACKDLGFELEMPETPSPPRMAIPATASSSPPCAGCCVDTSSTDSASSPISSWRISSPGDDPRDVKARLKVWAQAVALASASSSSSLQSN